jgi:hypothetical protein
MNYKVIFNCVGYCSMWFFVVTYDITSANRIGADAHINTRDSCVPQLYQRHRSYCVNLFSTVIPVKYSKWHLEANQQERR